MVDCVRSDRQLKQRTLNNQWMYPMQMSRVPFLLALPFLAASLAGLTASSAHAQPSSEPVAGKGSFTELKKEYDAAMKKFQEDREKALMDVRKELLEETQEAENALRVA